jgi:hypothetical protein
VKEKNSGETAAARVLRIQNEVVVVYRNFLQRNYDTLAGLFPQQEMAEFEQHLAELERLMSIYASTLTPGDLGF